MANQKVTELVEITSASDDDIVYIVDSPGSSPVSRKITIANLLQNCLKLVGGVLSGNLEIASSSAFYIGSSTVDGTWRFIRSGDNLVMQRRESGLWVDKLLVEA